MRRPTFANLFSLALAALGAGSLLGASGCGPSVSVGGDCTYDGKDYDVGDTFPAGDGCNTCSCEEGGSVACTEIGCLDQCEWDGQVHDVGESFPAGDGCNTCSCEEGGSVACTLLACAVCNYLGTEYFAGDMFPAGDGCNTCTCLEDGSVACTDMACPQQSCSYEGYFHPAGSSWESNDKCEACTCEVGGQAVCSDNGPCESCYYAGAFHEAGESFPALDGCNTCSCASDGGVSCTEINCPCDPAKEWFRDYIGLGDECQLIDFGCAEPTQSFFNTCGCGCEQPAWCPEVFQCGFADPCDVEWITTNCPYSAIESTD